MRFSLLAASVAAALIALPGLAAAQTTTVPAGKARIIDKHNVCKVIENTNAQDIMVPHKDRTEWSFGANAFLYTDRQGVKVRACDERWAEFDSTTTLYSPMTSNCAIDVHGDVYCWAIDLSVRNYVPTMYLGDQPPHTPTPTRITGLPAMDKVATSGHGTACGTASGSGDVWCWGVNVAPYKRTGVTGIVEIDGAYGQYTTGTNSTESIHFYCGKKSDNTMWCWITPGTPMSGYAASRNRAPFQVPNPRTGQIGAFAVANGELLWSVGPNTYVSYLRSDLTAPMRTFRMFKDPGDLVSLHVSLDGVTSGRDAMGAPDSQMLAPGCGIQSDGDLWCWGGDNSTNATRNHWSQYTLDKYGNSFYPTLIAPRAGDVDHIVHVGWTGFCVVYTDRRSFCERPYYNGSQPATWRPNDPMDSRAELLPQRFAKLMGGMYADLIVTVGGFSNGTSDADKWHAYGSGFACGLDGNGAIWCQGENNGAQLGDGTWTDRRNWTKISF